MRIGVKRSWLPWGKPTIMIDKIDSENIELREGSYCWVVESEFEHVGLKNVNI